ncbi:MAG: AMP-binding protein, partial [Planctomycetes bacterium]|nr:AMP-binding protein [Planctomycetota bacterium]
KVGEILVRGKHVSPEYYLDEESTRKNKVPDERGGAWHRFGDSGYIDGKGRLWVCGRVSQRVKAEGGPVFPLMCEPLFDAHPKVRRSGLVGVAGQAGELPVLCVEIEPEFRHSNADDLRAPAHDRPVVILCPGGCRRQQRNGQNRRRACDASNPVSHRSASPWCRPRSPAASARCRGASCLPPASSPRREVPEDRRRAAHGYQ